MWAPKIYMKYNQSGSGSLDWYQIGMLAALCAAGGLELHDP